MVGLRRVGGPSFADVKRRLLAMPRTVAARVAAAAAPELTTLAGGSYDTGRNVYGERRPLSTEGRALSLVRSGATRSQLAFVATGTVVRARLAAKYVRYLIGRYGILPNAKAAIPAAWDRRLRDTAAAVVVAVARGAP